MGRSHLLIALIFFFFNDTATTEIYTLSLHDALPIYTSSAPRWARRTVSDRFSSSSWNGRSEEHTSELQSRLHLVCRLLLEKKKNNNSESIDLIYRLYILHIFQSSG